MCHKTEFNQPIDSDFICLMERFRQIAPDVLHHVVKTENVSSQVMQSFALFNSSPIALSHKFRHMHPCSDKISLGELVKDLFWQEVPAATFAQQLNPVKRAMGALVQKIVLDCIHNLDRLLEIGSGGNPITEYLPALPISQKNMIRLSDCSALVVGEQKRKYPSNTWLQLDARELSACQPRNSYEGVVMVSVLDTLIRPDLVKVCSEIFKVLEPGGKLIHFAPRKSFPSTTLHDHTAEGSVLFPLTDSAMNWIGASRILLKDLEEKLQALDPLEGIGLVKPVRAYLSLTPAEREDWCSMMMVMGRKQEVAFISKCLEKLQLSAAETIDFEESSKRRMLEVLQGCGFTIDIFTQQSETYTGQRKDATHFEYPHDHLFHLRNGNTDLHFLGVLAPGMIQEVAECHVIVARKPA